MTTKAHSRFINHIEPDSNGIRTAQNVLYVTQAAHGFAVLNVLRHNGSDWEKAQANDPDTLAVGVVVAVIDTSNFIIAQSGFFNITHGLGTTSEVYYLSASAAGALTDIEPADYSQPVLTVLTSTLIMVDMYRPMLTASGGTSGGGTGFYDKVRLTAVGTSISIPVDLDRYGILSGQFNMISNQNINRPLIQFNSDSGETGYFNRRSNNNATPTNLTDLATVIGSSVDTDDRVLVNFSISKLYDGTDTTFICHYRGSSYEDQFDTEGTIRRIFSGNVNLTTLRFETDVTDGMKIGSVVHVKG